MIYRQHPRAYDLDWRYDAIQLCKEVIMLKSITKDLLNIDSKYQPILYFLLSEYDYYDDSKPSYPRTQKEIADNLGISYGKIRTMLRHLNRDFYHRIQGYIPLKNTDELVDAPSFINPEETLVECHIMYHGLSFIFPIILSQIPHVGETISFEFCLHLPIRTGVINAIEHDINGEQHFINMYINYDEKKEFDYFTWLYENECPQEVIDRFKKNKKK